MSSTTTVFSRAAAYVSRVSAGVGGRIETTTDLDLAAAAEAPEHEPSQEGEKSN